MLISSYNKKTAFSALFVIVLLMSFFLTATGTSGCTSACCCKMSIDFDTGRNYYGLGQGVDITFSANWKCNVEIEKIYIVRSSSGCTCCCCGCAEIVYKQTFPGGLDAIKGQGRRPWRWTWDQKTNAGEMVGPGSYKIYLETEECGRYDASFKICEKSVDPCNPCGSCSCTTRSCDKCFQPFLLCGSCNNSCQDYDRCENNCCQSNCCNSCN